MKRPCPNITLAALLLWPGWVLASPSSALREYKDGKYDQAAKEYDRLLEKRADDPRLHFNAGTAAYRNRHFDQAVKQFDESLAAPDLKLQGLSYYNRGNSRYYLGEANPDPNQRTEAWEKALKDYELSLKLDPQDADAKFNHQFVQKKLEELKQQQQQQQQDKSGQDKKDQNQQQQNQQNDQSKQDKQQQQAEDQQNDQSKQDQNQQQQQKQQNQSSQKQDSSQQNRQDQQKKDDARQPAAKQSQDQKQQQQKQQQANKASAQKKDKPDDKSNEEGAAYAEGQMTPEQAEQLLDAQKGEEMMLPVKPEGKPVDHSRPFKDW